MKIRVFWTVVFLFLANMTVLHGAVTFTLGNNPDLTDLKVENILFGVSQTGSTVTGYTNFSNTSVSFSSTQDILEASASGQSSLEAADGHLNSVTITLTGGGTYRGLIINPGASSKDGQLATVTVETNNGILSPYSYPLDNGQNYLAITAGPDEAIISTTISVPDGCDDLKQTRIYGIVMGQVPEPGTMLLLAGGLLVLGSRRLRLF